MKGKICTCATNGSIENGAAERHCQPWTLSTCGTTDNNNNNNDRLTAFDPGQPG